MIHNLMTKFMKKYIYSIFFFISSLILNAQNSTPYTNVIPPNPDAASLAKYADYPVDLSTGVVQVNIPVWEIKCGNISVPISLSYHGSGIPVAETPSYVGLGWTLNAGGAITRTIRGCADDGMSKRNAYTSSEISGLLTDYAVFPNYPENTVEYGNPSKYREAAAGKRDLEPDLFCYNFCNTSGIFVFDFNGVSHLIPKKNINIERILSTSSPSRIISLRITTDDGFKYYFEALEKTLQNTKTETRINDGSSLQTGSMISNSLNTSEFNSAWFLTKIEAPNSSKNIVFEYDDINIENSYPVSETYKEFLQCNGTPNYAQKGLWETTQTTATIYGKRLRKITSTDQSIEFIRGDYRFDLKGDQVLDKIIIRNNKSEILKQFKLSYNYFSEGGMTSPGTSANANTVANTKMRLSLKSIQEIDKNNLALPAQTFDYENSVWLPDRLTSKAQDHWGYFNGKLQNTTLIPNLNTTINLYSIRDVSENNLKAGSLTRITYPTGGFTQFIYEANNVTSSAYDMTGSGLRIKEKIDYDPNTNKSIHKKYDYNSSGYLGYSFNYVYQTGLQNEIYISHTSSSNTALNNGDGSIVRYRKVTIFEGDDINGIYGKTENEYTILQSDITYPGVYSYSSNPIPVILYTRSTGQFPFAPEISGGWGSGLLKCQTIYKFKNNVYLKTRQIVNSYKNDYWGRTDIYNKESDVLAARVGAVSSCSNCFGADEFGNSQIAVQFYYIPSRNIDLIKTEVTEYDDNQNPTVSNITNLKYNTIHQVSENITTDSNGDTINTKIKYPIDYTYYSGFIKAMRDKYMLNYPIEERKIRNGKVISATHNRYSSTLSPLVSGIYNIETTQPITESSFYGLDDLGNILSYTHYKENLIFDKYDSYGNLLQYHGKDNKYISFLWSYSNTYPIAKIENATYDEVNNAVGSSVISNLAQNPLPTRDDIEIIRTNINSSSKNALITTYTYKPLVGMNSVTDPRGVTTNYAYDTFNRLYLLRNDDKNVIGQYRYGYQNAPDNGLGGYIAPTASVTPGATTYTPGTTGTATLGSVVGGSGSYTYSWYLKNSTGTVLASNLNTTSTSFSFICSQSGQLTIQCVITDNTTGLSSTPSTTITSGAVTVYGSFSTTSGYTYPYTSLSKTGSSVTFVLVFLPTSSPISVGYDYYIASVSAGFQPSITRTISYDTGGRTWNITFNSNGSVYCRIVSGTNLPVGSVVAFGSLTYNL